MLSRPCSSDSDLEVLRRVEVVLAAARHERASGLATLDPVAAEDGRACVMDSQSFALPGHVQKAQNDSGAERMANCRAKWLV